MWRPVNEEQTPEGRLAAAAANLMLEMQQQFRHTPDYADFRDRFRAYMERELTLVRLNERLLHMSSSWELRNEELQSRLDRVKREIEQIERH